MEDNTEKRIEKISQYFAGMQVSRDGEGNNVIYVSVVFPANWVIAPDITEKFNVTVVEGNNCSGEYYFGSDMSVGFSKVFDAIDYNIEKMKNAQERAELMKKKIAELQSLFRNEDIPIEKLRSLRFEYTVEAIKPTPYVTEAIPIDSITASSSDKVVLTNSKLNASEVDTEQVKDKKSKKAK